MRPRADSCRRRRGNAATIGGILKRASILLLLGLLTILAGCLDNADPGFASEGSVAAPIDLGSAPTSHEGTVAGGGNSYYKATTEGGGTFTLSNLLKNADMAVYASADFTFPLCFGIRPSNAPDSCFVTICPSPCTHYIRVVGVDAGGTSFLVSVQ